MHRLKFVCYRMDQYEEHFEENSDNEVENEQEEVVVGVIAPQPVKICLVVVVPGVADNPESSSMSPPRPSPPQGSPLEDVPSFMGFDTHDDIIDLEQWSVDARAARVNPAIRNEEPDV